MKYTLTVDVECAGDLADILENIAPMLRKGFAVAPSQAEGWRSEYILLLDQRADGHGDCVGELWQGGVS